MSYSVDAFTSELISGPLPSSIYLKLDLCYKVEYEQEGYSRKEGPWAEDQTVTYVSSAAAARHIARDKLREKLGWHSRLRLGWLGSDEADLGQDVVVFKDEAGGCVWRAVYRDDVLRDEDYTKHTVAVHQRYMPQDKIQHVPEVSEEGSLFQRERAGRWGIQPDDFDELEEEDD
ncbi:unnamed protein product [Vitrella brassicaformis CCMP3155]|uniref:Uncharacterized protein n=2 Tax=Vitrella brassicaformis TaxID=1169539 RepID=A0A0G4GSR8_VITBC|nr:unnamed protein product [Vitrella brassicaformis CCMP3155]|mmetsp:Transcript_40143/g.100475  ORF Transcript_40143/g.100475 Transcript_40143/m.100475 type:complete len:174 (+) Transcript_40143:114-635(+)|eukprot:CEM33515.1 unnamed protein product [Vitrella brassicaformis CCMP3155]